MINQTRTAIACAAFAALLAGLSGCKCPPLQVSADGYLAILKEPQSQLVPVGALVNFSVVAVHTGAFLTNALSYQWRFNDGDIPTATNSTFSITNVQFADAGQYSVMVTGSQLLSQSADLTVYAETANGGALTVGITSFKIGNNGQACFPAASGWDRYFVITNYLLGPHVSPLPNPNPFPNPNDLNSVTIDTLTNLNGTTLDTGIVINYEFNPSEKVCNDDTTTPFPNPKLSSARFTPTGLNKRYRATVFYRSSTGPPSNIIVRWNYP